MSSPDFNIEIAVDGEDQIVAIEPPVDNAFREEVYDVLDGMGLIKEIVVRGGNFFETQHLADGSPYSELRISGTALSVAGQSLVNIAHQCAEVLRGLDRTADVSPYIIAAGGTQKLFDKRHP